MILLLFIINHQTMYAFYGIFLIVIISLVTTAFPLGRIIDRIGRKFALLIGICCYFSCGFMAVTVGIENLGLQVLAGILLGIGYGSVSGITSIYQHEIVEHGTYFDFRSNEAVLVYAGALVGAVFLVFFDIFLPKQPFIILAFFLIGGSALVFVLFQLRETLPAPDEIAWRNAIQFLYVVDKSGICIYENYFEEFSHHQQSPDQDLLGGYLVAISTLLKEIAQDNKPVEMVKKEGFSIMLEEGKNVIVTLITLLELKILREKLRAFTEDFEVMFCRSSVHHQTSILDMFSPANMLVHKYFAT